ncbi:YfhD family protein [Priestia megaterium]|nr:YfhD family protein [Priestia megaterium]
MGRANNHKSSNHNKSSLPQTPKNLKIPSDGVDEEFSLELADHDDMEAQARANAANQRQQGKQR